MGKSVILMKSGIVGCGSIFHRSHKLVDKNQTHKTHSFHFVNGNMLLKFIHLHSSHKISTKLEIPMFLQGSSVSRRTLNYYQLYLTNLSLVIIWLTEISCFIETVNGYAVKSESCRRLWGKKNLSLIIVSWKQIPQTRIVRHQYAIFSIITEKLTKMRNWANKIQWGV